MTQQGSIEQINPNIFSRVTFWDTNISQIDRSRHAEFVIERVFGYGTEEERIRLFANTFTPSPYNRNVIPNIQKALSHATL